MPKYEYRFRSSTGSIKLGAILNVQNDASAKAHGDKFFATFLDFDSLEVWLLDRHIETLRRAPNPNHKPLAPHVTDAEKLLRRRVAMAYRTALEAGRSHHAALAAAKAVYYRARPEAMSNPLAASARINELIASSRPNASTKIF